MNKEKNKERIPEKIKRIYRIRNKNNKLINGYIDNYIFQTEVELLLKYIQHLEQKEVILDKVKEECKKQITEYEDSILEIFPQKILNIIEREKK